MAVSIGKAEACAEILFLDLNGHNAKKIHAELVAVYGDNVLAYDTVVKWWGTIKAKRRGRLTKDILLLHDNAPAYLAQDKKTHTASIGYEIFPHAPYSPDSKWPLFLLSHEEHTKRKTFPGWRGSDCSSGALPGLSNEEFYSNVVWQLVHHWQKCMALGREYVEKD